GRRPPAQSPANGRARRMNGNHPVCKVSVRNFFEPGAERLQLELVAGQRGMARTIREPAINRPGLALAGFYRFFAHHRIQLIGFAEYAYLMSLQAGVRAERVADLFATRVPCIVFSRNKKPFADVAALAEKFCVPVMRTGMVTGHFMNAATIIMEDLSAPRCKVYGTMLEVAGVGVMIEGQPGIGKSETALGLIKRGHALVADDLTQLRRDSGGKLIGAAIEVTRFYMEIRGLGIIYVPAIFGVSAVRGEKQLDLVVTLMRQADVDADLDRAGETELKREFLGVNVPQVVLPVAPGRDLVNIVETVAQEYKLRLSGQIAFKDLDERIKRHHAAGVENKA
ncbi:MAG: HPr(Ser) kinase/phosphatase, partial [Kiritimatiellae bacterium]|nr:HPr(Ser) kinase/phosphatase [Kiritimatiellia bacterium]